MSSRFNVFSDLISALNNENLVIMIKAPFNVLRCPIEPGFDSAGNLAEFTTKTGKLLRIL